MQPRNRLQDKIGGPISALDCAELIAAAERNIAAMAPELNAALLDYRERLRRAVHKPDLDLPGVFSAAHQIRGLAGAVGRPSIGFLADILASYITACVDSETACHKLVVEQIAAALSRAFHLNEGDALLREGLAAAAQMTAAFAPRARDDPGAPLEWT